MIGWYVHHHGAGHEARMRAVTAHLDMPVTVFSSRPGMDVTLPLDVDAPRSHACAAMPASPRWHHAPVGVDPLRQRMATMARFMGEGDPSLMVVDVSVEVAGLARLMSVPTVVVRQHGRRDDTPHVDCYAEAARLLAPYPRWLEDRDTPIWVIDKTDHVGGFSRMDGRRIAAAEARAALGLDDRPLVVVLSGDGGRVGWPIDEAAAATPEWRWQVLARDRHGLGVDCRFVEDPRDWLCAADVVVTHAGHNSVMEVAALRRPMVVIPQDRPHDEQRHKAAALRRADIGIVLDEWPTARSWPDLLAGARRLPVGHTRLLVDGRGAQRAAQAIGRQADACAPRGQVVSLP